MLSFKISFFNVLLALMYMLPGYILCKVKKANASHLSTLSQILIFVLSPCMIISSFLSFDYSITNLIYMGLFFVASLVMQLIFIGILVLILHKKFHINRYRMLAVGSVLGNCGFFGLPLIKALLPNNPEVACYSSIYVITMNVLVFTAGVFCITNDKKYISIKSALINPAFFSLLIALPLYIFKGSTRIPQLAQDGISLLGKMTTPVCMLILGIRLATMDFKKLFLNPFIYLVCAGKLIIFPLFAYAMFVFIPLPAAFKGSLFILAATPCASVILNLAEIHGKEAELSANCILLSTLLCIITIPLLSFLL